MSKRKILTLAMALSIVAIMAVGATIAYFTDNDAAKNTFTVGNVSIDLTEPKWDEAGSKDAPEVYPGEALAKDPTVTNDGKNPCFVRISVSNLDQFGNKGAITYRTDYVPNALGENWVYNEADKYFYYTKVLAAGETTDALFDQIVIPTVLTNKDGLELPDTYSIDVTAYAVQAQGAFSSYEAVKKMSVAQIYVWFNRCAPDEW